MTVIYGIGNVNNEPYVIYTKNRIVRVGDKLYKDPLVMTTNGGVTTYHRDRSAWLQTDWSSPSRFVHWDDMFLLMNRSHGDTQFHLTACEHWPSALTPPLAP